MIGILARRNLTLRPWRSALLLGGFGLGVGVMIVLLAIGEAMLTRSSALAVYWVVWFACANLFVIGYEEPTLRQMFGRSYEEYTRRVGRWIPKSRSQVITV